MDAAQASGHVSGDCGTEHPNSFVTVIPIGDFLFKLFLIMLILPPFFIIVLTSFLTLHVYVGKHPSLLSFQDFFSDHVTTF